MNIAILLQGLILKADIIILIGENVLGPDFSTDLKNEGVKTTRLSGEESTGVEGLDLRLLRYGTLGGMSNAIAKNIMFGTPITPTGAVKERIADYKSIIGVKSDPIYRSGGIYGFLSSLGVFPKGLAGLGRDILINKTSNEKYNNYMFTHETVHYWQQQQEGWANFTWSAFLEQVRLGGAAYNTTGTFECAANTASLIMGYPYPY